MRHPRRSALLAMATIAALALVQAVPPAGGQGGDRPRCLGKRATILGTNGGDRIHGSRRADVIVTLGGRDVVNGRGGADLICTGPGRDRADGGAGRDSCRDAERVLACERLLYRRLTVGGSRKLTVPASVTRLQVDGKLTVGRRASIESSAEMLALVVRGDMALAGTVRSAGHVAIVGRASQLPSRAELQRQTGVNQVGRPRSASAAQARRSWRISGDIVAADESLQDGTQADANLGAIVVRAPGNLRLGRAGARASQAGVSATFKTANGRSGTDRSACNTTGGDGRQGLPSRLTSVGRLVIANVRFTGGSGGRGGNATGVNCLTSHTNTGGKGGPPGEIQVGGNLGTVVNGSLRFEDHDGGPGGVGSITGAVNDPGYSPLGVGGAGGDVKARLAFMRVTLGPGGQISSSMGSGGRGGDASGTGGDGIPWTECNAALAATRKAGDGGDGRSQGGKGGDVDVKVSGDTGLGVVITGFLAGNGGDAAATGGNGGKGADCDRQGGRGGDGGTPMAAAGPPGTSINSPASGGSGATTRQGGNGGNGGNAAPPPAVNSVGGDGGTCRPPNAIGGQGGTGATMGVTQPNC